MVNIENNRYNNRVPGAAGGQKKQKVPAINVDTLRAGEKETRNVNVVRIVLRSHADFKLVY